jgi:PIN domain nuclease of toxin-antitoxin system
MNLLIDTQVLIWWAANSNRLGQGARELIAAPQNQVWVSVASIWEISIKTSIGRLEISAILTARMSDDLERHGLRSLPIEVRHALAVRELPLHHRDPIDRMLIAQARCEDLTLLTADRSLTAYDVRTIDAAL